MNAEELKLVDRIVAGDKGAMETLYEQYRPRLGRFVHRIVRDVDLTQELINDTMLAVWQSAGKFRRESTVSTWILGIAYRKSLAALRRHKRHDELIRQAPVTQGGGDGIPDYLARRDLDKLLRRLSPEQRAVAELSFDFGYSYPEVADILDIPVNTVKTRMYYARKVMQAQYDNDGAKR